jgi:cytochrome c-type biogenesis protein CcmH/NrfG
VLLGVAMDAVTYDPDHNMHHYRLAQGHFNMGEYDKARAAMDNLLRRVPPDDPMMPSIQDLNGVINAKFSPQGS